MASVMFSFKIFTSLNFVLRFTDLQNSPPSISTIQTTPPLLNFADWPALFFSNPPFRVSGRSAFKGFAFPTNFLVFHLE